MAGGGHAIGNHFDVVDDGVEIAREKDGTPTKDSSGNTISLPQLRCRTCELRGGLTVLENTSCTRSDPMI